MSLIGYSSTSESKGPKRVKIADAAGDTVTFAQYDNGVLMLPPFDRFDFDALKKMTMREDDVVLCSYPRSGCHWLWEQMRMITHGSTTLDVSEKQSSMLENNTVEILSRLPSPRVFNHHLRFHHLPDDVVKKRTKLVLIYRNPKDVAVSQYHLHKTGHWWDYNGHFHNWLSLFFAGKVDWGSCADYMNDWAKVIEGNPDHPIHVMTYEGLKKNPIQELTRLSLFLGKEPDVSFLQSVSDACAIDRMRKRKGHLWEDMGTKDTLMYREGKTGGWKNLFTVTLNEQFDRYWAEAFTASNTFPFDYDV